MNSLEYISNRLRIALLAALTMLSAVGNGETTDESPLKENPALADYLAYAVSHNPGLEAAFNRWKAALEEIPQADALPDPKLTYAYFIEEVETRVGPQEQKVGLSQRVPWFGKLDLRGDVAAEDAKAMYERYQAARLNLFYEVKESYYEYYYLSRAIGITEENVQLLKHLESVARSKHKAGASISGVIKAQVELGKLDDRLRSLRALRGPIMARLNAALNCPPDVPRPWPTAPEFGEEEISETEVFALFAATNPDLKTLDHLVVKAEKSMALARKDSFPDFMLGVDYIVTGDALMADSVDSGKDPIIAMVALDLPIWRGKYRAGEKEASLRRHAAERAREDKQNDLESSLKMALYRFRDAERKINLYGETLIPQATQSLKVTEEAYRAGSVDFLSLIDAERLLLEFRLSHERSLANREITLAEIERLVGTPLYSKEAKAGGRYEGQ